MAKLNSRAKGATAEREVIDHAKHIWPDAKRNLEQSRSGGRDLDNTEPFCVEIKRREKLNLSEAYKQAEAGTDETYRIPVVVHRRSREPWLVTISLETFMELVYLADVDDLS